MSGPVTAEDAPDRGSADVREHGDLEILPGREATVGAFGVRRVLPRRERRTVGAWCFVDHMGPAQVSEDRGLDIGPHPHIGLQTVTWLVSGEVLHRDSLGSEQVIRPGQLNLMSAGHGVSHSEEATGSYRGELHGVQLWVAQPAGTRDSPAAFEHHGELPRVEMGTVTVTVMVGRFAGQESPARRDTAHVAAELDLRPGPAVLPLDPSHEYGLVALDRPVEVGRRQLEPGHLGYLGIGRDEMALTSTGRSRALLIGGEPFPEPVLMWWNYVARDRSEIVAAHREWTAGGERFGRFRSPLPRIVAGPPPWSGKPGPPDPAAT
ncbi:MAG TPA: pirin family protein [Acidimicrobiales bacterium]|nr:pirin family protein [Acidimicrobiales bacterium]